MSKSPRYQIIDGIKCYNPQVASDYSSYPGAGFDVSENESDRNFWVDSRNRLFKFLVEKYIDSSRTTNFLEIGCHTGEFIRQIKVNKNICITGSEIYLKGLSYAKVNLSDVNLVQYDVTQGTLEEVFDVIVALDVIEHIEQEDAALFNIHQMLVDEGVFIMSVPQHKFLWSQLDVIVKHQRRYSKQDLVAKLEKLNFKIEYVTSFLFLLFPLMLISRLLDGAGKDAYSADKNLEKRVRFSKYLNSALNFFMRFDEFLIKKGFSLPFGGTLVVIAKKKV